MIFQGEPGAGGDIGARGQRGPSGYIGETGSRGPKGSAVCNTRQHIIEG